MRSQPESTPTHPVPLLDYQPSHLDLAGGVHNILLARIRARSELKRFRAASTFLQFSCGLGRTIADLRFRYNPREGSELYIVLNEGRNGDLQRLSPAFPRLDGRTLPAKYRHAFIL